MDSMKDALIAAGFTASVGSVPEYAEPQYDQSVTAELAALYQRQERTVKSQYQYDYGSQERKDHEH